jgi:hypothetical protein
MMFPDLDDRVPQSLAVIRGMSGLRNNSTMGILLRKLTTNIPSHWVNIAHMNWGSRAETADRLIPAYFKVK